jgi:crotonobetainyl-CoA:carnitine CoA-transferase CaiB-like acyl-CoA transferase
MPDTALSDLVVLDLGTDVTGPYCAKLLGDYGADVIKIEPLGGDPARRTGPFPGDVPHREKSGLFLHLNTNKRSVTLNLQTPTGRSILLDLVKRANVLIENNIPGYMDDLDLGWDDLAEVNPRLVMTSITPFGQDGPYKDYAAEEITVFAMGSRMYVVHGQPDREPLRYAPDTAWFQVGATAALATMGGVFAQRRFDIGQQIDVSALEALVGNVDAGTVAYSMTGVKREGRTRQTVSSAQGVVPCLDGFMLMIAGGERFFRRLLRAIGHPELAQDPRFATAAARSEHRDDFDAIFLPWCLERTRREIFQQLQAYSVMCAPIQTVDEVFTDPQEVARNFFVEIDHPEAGRLLYPGRLSLWRRHPGRSAARAAPRPAQRKVLCGELGLSSRS